MRLLLVFHLLSSGGFVLLPLQDPVNGISKGSQALLRLATDAEVIIVTVEHAAHDLILFHQDGNGLFFINTGLVLIGLGVLAERILQVLDNANIVNNQAAGFVAKHTVDPSDSLHQPMSPEELAFYDALAENQSAVEAMGSEQLRIIATELVQQMRGSATVDWQHKVTARARMRVLVKRILKKYGYPPDLEQEAVQTVLAQAEVMLREVTQNA